jgi:hypothetical protein
VTARQEFEAELARRQDIKQRQEDILGLVPSAKTPPGEENLDEELEAAKEALQHALSRQKAADADVRKAKREFDAGVAPGGLSSSRGPLVPARDATIRTLNPAQLAADAKQRRESADAQKKAEREFRENAIFRGPEVQAVSAAAGVLKQEAGAMCDEMLSALEKAVEQLREERDQLRIRLERAERGTNDDFARTETELNWIDFASSQAKKSLDAAEFKQKGRSQKNISGTNVRPGSAAAAKPDWK